MKKVGLYLSLVAVVGFLSAPVWAGPKALSDSDMDGVFAQGIVIENSFEDNNKFSNTQGQANLSKNGNYQSNEPTNTTTVESSKAYGGDAKDANAKAYGGDGKALAYGAGKGGDGGDASEFYEGGDGGAGVGVGVAVAWGGDADAEAENEGGDAYNKSKAFSANYDKNYAKNYTEGKNFAESYQIDKTFVDQKIYFERVAIATDYGIAINQSENGFFQAQTNGPNSFNNTQNQLKGEAYNDGPAINTEVFTDSYTYATADGYAQSDKAFAKAENYNETIQVPVAVSAAANLGAAEAKTFNKAYADGGKNEQKLESEAKNWGYADADNKAKSAALGLGLGFSNAGSESGDATGGYATSGDATATAGPDELEPGDATAKSKAIGGDAWSASKGGKSYAPFDQETKTDDIDQKAKAISDQKAKAGDIYGLQDASADADAKAETYAGVKQDADADKADAKALNDNDQKADADAKSVAENTTKAWNENVYTSTFVKQVNNVKSVYVVKGQNENSGVINNGAQGAITAQQVNAVVTTSTANFSGPINMGNAITSNGIFN